MSKPKKREVDGTVKGMAILITVKFNSDDPKPLHSTFTESDDCANPERSAVALWESIKDDWKDRGHSIILNERARYLATRGRMKDMGFDEYTPAEYLATWTS